AVGAPEGGVPDGGYIEPSHRYPPLGKRYGRYLRSGNSAMASFARTPPVIEIGTNFVRLANSSLEIMIWSMRVASWSTDAAKTSRPKRHHRIAPMHMAQGSPVV